jgi:repressor LexA
MGKHCRPVAQRTALGNRIAQLRRANHLSQQELGEKVGLTRGYISQIETGIQREINNSLIQKFADVLEVPVEDLLTRVLPISQGTTGFPESETKLLLNQIKKLQEQLTHYGTVLHIPGEQVVDVAGRIPAGFPEIPESEAVERLIIRNNWFAIRVSGDSLLDLGVEPLDILIIDPSEGIVPRNGQVVIVELPDRSITIKRWYPENDHVRLEPAGTHQEAFLTRDVKILGVVKIIWKEL